LLLLFLHHFALALAHLIHLHHVDLGSCVFITLDHAEATLKEATEQAQAEDPANLVLDQGKPRYI
jgi:hypothetical protein